MKHGQIVLVADIRGTEHECDARRLPAKRQIPILDAALQLAIDEQAATRFRRLVIHVGTRERRLRHLHHRAFLERNGPHCTFVGFQM